MTITLEQIPDEVVKDALWTWLTHTGNNDVGMRAAIAAALNAWPEMYTATLGSDGDLRIILPLLQESE